MRLVTRVLRYVLQPFRLVGRILAPVGPSLNSLSPRRMKTNLGYGRTLAAPLWRRLHRYAIVLVGFGVYAGLQLWIANWVGNPAHWFHIWGVFIIFASIVIAVVRPHIAFLLWLILSPWVALFWKE